MLVLFVVPGFGQSSKKVFMIGEYQETYDKIMMEYKSHLLEVCDNSMDNAYQKWSGVLYDLEKYVIAEDFDIRGVKLWMNVFFNKNGKIDYLVFYPKPVSKNMNYEKLEDILEKFVINYKSGITSEKSFSHYGSASFPVFYSTYKRDDE